MPIVYGLYFRHKKQKEPGKGLLHRENGPAVIYPNGDKEWWVDGVKIREEKNDETN